MNLLRLSLRMVLRRVRQHWMGSLFLVFAIALATSVFLAILYASYQSVRSFEGSLSTVASSHSVELRSRTGVFDQALLASWMPYARPSTAFVLILEGQIGLRRADRFERLSLRAVGFSGSVGAASRGLLHQRSLSEGDLLLDRRTAARLGLSAGEVVPCGTEAGPTSDMRVVLSEEEEDTTGGFGLVNLSTGRRLLHSPGGLTAVLILDQTRSSAQLNQELKSLVAKAAPRGLLYVENAEERTETAAGMLQAFRSNILALVVLSCLVCVLVVYNAANLSTLSSRDEYRVLRTLGVSSFGIAMLVILEFGTLGVCGACVGLTLAQPLSSAIAALFLGTVRDLYLGAHAFPEIRFLQWQWLYALSFLTGTACAILGALRPAIEASRVRGGFSIGGLRLQTTFSWTVTLWSLAACLFASAGCIWVALRSAQVGFAYAATLLLVASAFCFAPIAIRVLTLAHFRRAFAQSRVSGLLALANLQASGKSHAFSVAVSATALSLLLALSIMVGSFRGALETWVNYTFRADVFLRSADPGSYNRPAYLPFSIAEKIFTLPEIQDVSIYSAFVTAIGPELVSVGGADIAKGVTRGIYQVLGGAIDPQKMRLGECVAFSQSASRKLRKSVGDSVVVEGIRSRVCAIFQDFSSERGTILFDREFLQTRVQLPGATSMAVYAKPEVDLPALQTVLRGLVGTDSVLVTLNSDLRKLVFKIFDETFRITAVLQGIVGALSGIGFAVSLLQLVWERRRELKTVRVLGASNLQIQSAFFFEGVALVLPIVAIGSGLGTILAWILIAVINPVSFGWSFEPRYSLYFYVNGAVLIFVANALASALPFRIGSGIIKSARLSEE